MFIDFDHKQIESEFKDIVIKDEFKPSYNIAPTQDVPAIVYGSMILTKLSWGLIPHWAKDDSFRAKMINARADTLTEKPAFRDAFYRSRCVIVISGFYEWKAKQPYAFIPGEGKILLLAGLYSEWHDKVNDKSVATCTVITTEANEFMKEYHHRMPLILSKKDVPYWIDPLSSEEDIMPLLSQCPVDLKAYPVSHAVNIAMNNFPDLIKPNASQATL